MHLEAFGWALWFIIQPPLCIHSFYRPLYTSSSDAWDKYFLHNQQGISSSWFMVNVHIGSAIFLRFLFVLFVNFGMKCSRKKNIHSGLQLATGPGCMEVQTAVRRNLICGLRGDRACISISRRHSCSRKHTLLACWHQLATFWHLKTPGRISVSERCGS